MSGLSLLAPLGLLALLSVPVVVLLHMRHTTPREQPVPTLRFWLAVAPEQTDRTRFKRPPLSLLLLLQLLVVGLLAFGLTRPASSETLGGLNLRTEPQHLIVLLDGSTSMAAVDAADGPTRFERARQLVLERIGNLREGDVATVLLLGTRTTTYEATDAGGFASLRDRLAGIGLPGGRADLSAALRLAHDLLLPRMADRVLVVSDGALPVDPGVVADLGASVELAQVGATVGNVAITDLAASTDPSMPTVQRLLVRVRNFEAQPVTAPVVVTIDGLEFARREITIPELGGENELVWELPADATNVVAAIEVLDALAADNSASLILHQADALALDILLVSDAPTYLQRALAVLPGAQVMSEPTGTAGAAISRQAYDLVVYDGFAPPVEELPAAPLLFVHPPTESGPFVSTGLMPDPAVGPVQPNDPLLFGVDLGGVSFGPTPIFEFDAAFSEVIGAVDRSGTERGPILVRGTLGGQPTIALASDLNQSNLPRRVAFPILIANIARELAPSPFPASLPLGDPFGYRVGAEAAAVRVAPPVGDPVTLPLPATTATTPASETTAGDAADTNDGAATAGGAPAGIAREVTFTDTGQPGLYQVSELDATGNPLSEGRFVVNAGHPQESDLRPNPDLASTLATARPTTDLAANADLSDFWPLLVLAAVAILALEWLVALFRRRRATGYQASGVGRQASATGGARAVSR